MSLLDRVLEDLAATTLPEFAAVALALAYVVLAVRRSLWCWPCAFVSVAIYAVLFARTGLVMQSALQVFYLGMAVYGWIDWRRGRTAAGTLAIETRGWRWHVVVIALIVVATLVNGWLLARSSAAVEPYVDAFVTWASIATTWMVARRLLENWIYWIVIDVVAAWLYFSQSLALTSMLFAVYVVIAVRGHFSWRREWLAQVATDPPGAPARAVEAMRHGSH